MNKIAGYPLTQFTIRPFANHDLTDEEDEAAACRHWNRELSALRVAVEHAFGMLKGRFPALRSLPGHNLRVMWSTVEALMIVHNILTECGDNPYDIQGFNGQEDVDLVPEEAEEDVWVQNAHGHTRMMEDELFQAGLLHRKELLDMFQGN